MYDNYGNLFEIMVNVENYTIENYSTTNTLIIMNSVMFRFMIKNDLYAIDNYDCGLIMFWQNIGQSNITILATHTHKHLKIHTHTLTHM